MLHFSMIALAFTFFQYSNFVSAWLPTFGKVRGVNLGSHFLIEP